MKKTKMILFDVQSRFTSPTNHICLNGFEITQDAFKEWAGRHVAEKELIVTYYENAKILVIDEPEKLVEFLAQ